MPPVLDAPRLTGEKIAPEPTDKAANGAEFVTLAGVRWETYESLMADYAYRSGPRFTYDRGMLEIMSPLAKHERPYVRLCLFVDNVTEVWKMPAENFGNTTFRREDLARGWEPDACYYLQNAEYVVNSDEIDMENGDPPPDLTIEVEETNSAIPRLPLFAAFGVPEVWRVTKERKVVIHILDKATGTYFVNPQSGVLPLVSSSVLEDFLEKAQAQSRFAWLKAVRKWAREAAAAQKQRSRDADENAASSAQPPNQAETPPFG